MKWMQQLRALLLFIFAGTATGEGTHSKREGTTMNRISDETIKLCNEPGNGLALARVSSVETEAPNGQSEQVLIRFATERTILGSLRARPLVRTFKSKGNTLLTSGHRYIVALLAGENFGDYQLKESIEVPDGHEKEAVELNQRAVWDLVKTISNTTL